VNSSWQWLNPQVLLAVHDEQLAEHGGASGTRDLGLFESALAKPQNLAHYGQPDAAALAAAYGCGIARNHPFIDGNKRTAFVAVELFLYLNQMELTASDTQCVAAMLGVAEGSIDEAQFAAWLRTHIQPRT
jgi:death on curing protein